MFPYFSYTISRDDSRSPTAFVMELEDSKTSDTLTMTPAGAHSRPLVSNLAQELNLRDNMSESLGSVPDFGALDFASNAGGRRGHPGFGNLGMPRRDLGSIPNLGSIESGSGLRSRPDLGSIPNLGSIPPALGSVPGNMDSMVDQPLTTTSRRIPNLGSGQALGTVPGLRPDLGQVPPFEDSGVESYEYSKFKVDNNDTGSDSIPELEEALLKLNPQEVEQKRKRMFSMSRYSFELGSDGGFESPGSSMFGQGLHQKGFLPYGVRTPDSLSIGNVQILYKIKLQFCTLGGVS